MREKRDAGAASGSPEMPVKTAYPELTGEVAMVGAPLDTTRADRGGAAAPGIGEECCRRFLRSAGEPKSVTDIADQVHTADSATDRDLRHRCGRAGVDPSHLGGDRQHAQRPGLPPRLPPDRQPARRRGPHPGGLRPRLPLPVDVHARHLRGLAAPHHHEPLPGHGPAQAAHPLRRARRRRGRAAAQP